jgi:hypothetical protein
MDSKSLRNMSNVRFGKHHGLGTSKSTEGGVGRQVSLAHPSAGSEVGNEVGIINMEQRAISDTTRQVHSATSVGIDLDVKSLNLSFLCNTNLVFECKGVSSATRKHIFIAVENNADRAMQLVGSDGRGSRNINGSGFLCFCQKRNFCQ